MEVAGPRFCLKAAVDGFFASLLYLDEILPPTNHRFNDIFLLPQRHESWVFINNIRNHLRHCCTRLMEAVSILGLAALDATLDSFANPTRFYESAIFSFRNFLAGLMPDSLGSVFALCSLSHICSCYLRNRDNPIICDNFPDIGSWENAIRNHQHRQAFSDLIQALWPKTSSPFCDVPHFGSIQEMRSALANPCYGDTQEILPGVPVAQDESSFDGLLTHLTELDGVILGSLAGPNTQLQSQIEQGSFTNVENTQLTGLQMVNLQALQNSSVITNLTHFLEECGELVHILSGSGLTAKSLHSCIVFNQNGVEVKEFIKSSYIQPLRNDESFKDISTLGILSIVNRFVDLGHLQSVEEARDYTIIVGREILPNEKSFVDFFRSVCAFASTHMAEMSTASSHRSDSRLKPTFPCPICGKDFARKFNMRRHFERKHSSHT